MFYDHLFHWRKKTTSILLLCPKILFKQRFILLFFIIKEMYCTETKKVRQKKLKNNGFLCLCIKNVCSLLYLPHRWKKRAMVSPQRVRMMLMSTISSPSISGLGGNKGESPESENDADGYNLLSVYQWPWIMENLRGGKSSWMSSLNWKRQKSKWRGVCTSPRHQREWNVCIFQSMLLPLIQRIHSLHM